MKRTWMIAVLSACVATVMPKVAAAQSNGQEILSIIPADAYAALVARNVGELDRKIMGLLQQFGMQPISALSMIKGTLGVQTGVDDGGSAAAVMMPLQNLGDFAQGLVILIPSADYAALIGQLQPEDVGGGVSKVLVTNQESYVCQRGKFAVLGATPEVVKSFLAAEGKPTAKSAWSTHLQQRYGNDDLTLWVNAKDVLANPQVSGSIQMFAAMSGGTMDVASIMAWQTAGVAVRLGDDGIRLGLYGGVDKDSAQAKAAGAPTSEPLLGGLPKENYLIAGGGRFTAAEAKIVAENLARQFKSPMLAGVIDPQQADKLGQALSTLWSDVRGLSVSISGLPAGPNGLVGLAKVVEVQGNAKDTCDKIGEIFNTVIAMVPPDKADVVKESIKYRPGAETIAGKSVDQLVVLLDKVPDLTDEDRAKVSKVLGRDGIVFRFAAVDDTHLVGSFGGGPERFQKIVELVQSKSAPLTADQGIKQTADSLPKQRTMEGFLSVGNLASTVMAISKALDEPLAFPLPQVNAPAGVSIAPVGPGETQVNIMLPTELVVAIKDVAMMGMMGGMGAPPPPPPGGMDDGTQ